MAHAVYAFDAYGTLFDVHAAVRRYSSGIGADAQLLSDIWRQKQLEYSWVRALMQRYEDFWTLTEQALDFALRKVPSADPALRDQLLEAYRSLDCYPEIPKVLTALRDKGARLAILSNGSPAMLEGAARSAGIADLFEEIVSVDEIRTYKTDEQVYELITTRFRVYPEAVSFQSSNRWDIAGATAFGFRTVWINRSEQPDEYQDLPPAAVLTSLDGLLNLD